MMRMKTIENCIKKAGFFVSNRYSDQKERYLEMPICEIGKDDI